MNKVPSSRPSLKMMDPAQVKINYENDYPKILVGRYRPEMGLIATKAAVAADKIVNYVIDRSVEILMSHHLEKKMMPHVKNSYLGLIHSCVNAEFIDHGTVAQDLREDDEPVIIILYCSPLT